MRGVSYAALVRNVEIFVMPGMIYRDRKRKREEREGGRVRAWPEGREGKRGGEGTDQPKSRIFMAMRGGREATSVGEGKRKK